MRKVWLGVVAAGGVVLAGLGGVYLWAVTLAAGIAASGLRFRAQRRTLLASLLIVGIAPALMGPNDITLSNNPDSGEEPTNFNAETISIFLSFNNVHLSATNSISVIENIDVSAHLFGGVNARNLTMSSSVFNLDYDMIFGTGLIGVNAATANLTGRFLNHDGSLRDSSGFAVTAQAPTTMNVLGANASIQQGIDLAAVLASVSVLAGTAVDLVIGDSKHAQIRGGTISGTVVSDDAAILEFFGSGFEVDTGSGFVPVGLGALGSTSGTLRGTLSSGDLIEVDFLQGGGAHTGSIVLVPEPSTALLIIGGLGILAGRRRPAN